MSKSFIQLCQRGKPTGSSWPTLATGLIVLVLLMHPAPQPPLRHAAPGEPPLGATPEERQGEGEDEDEG